MKGHGINHPTTCLLHFIICFKINSVHNHCTQFIHFTSFWYHIRWFTPYFFHFLMMLISKQHHNQYLYEYLRISLGLVSRGGIPKSKAMCILRPAWYGKMILPGDDTNSHFHRFFLHHILANRMLSDKMFCLSTGWVWMICLKYKVMFIDLKLGHKLCQTLNMH